MFCPQCKSEYVDGIQRCTECEVKLVPSLPETRTNAAERVESAGELSVVLWSGQDPIAFSVILSALDAAEMPYKESQRRDFNAQLSQPLALSHYGLPNWEVRVHPSNLDTARTIMETALRPMATVVEDSSKQKKIDDRSRVPVEPADSLEGFRPPVKVWSGKGVSRAQVLRNALVSQHIPCWALTAFLGGVRLLVRPDDHRRAQEIIREALKRTPAA